MQSERPVTSPVSLLRLAALGLLLAALLVLCASCTAPPSGDEEFAVGKCAVCQGSGMCFRSCCPSCRGLGYVRVKYSYPVIEPVK